MPHFKFFKLKKLAFYANSMKKTSSMSKDSSNLSKPRFACYFCCSLVNFKNLTILFGKCGFYMVCEKAVEVLCLIQNI